MIDFVIESEIARPPADLFAHVKLASWQTNTGSAMPEPDGPIRLGTRSVERPENARGPGAGQVATPSTLAGAR